MANVALHEGSREVGYSKNERADNSLQSRLRDFSMRANKDIADAELREKVVDIERKRRHSLVLWHQNVMRLHQELWQMSEELEDSLVRDEKDDTPDQIKKSLQNTKSIEEMTEEELSKLPILMRPRPKYPPEKHMFMTKRQAQDINNHNFEATLERLRGGESEFIRLVHSGTEVNQRQGESGGQSFPSLRVPQHYRILLDPEKQKRLEVKGALRRAKTMPAGGFKANKADKSFNSLLASTGRSTKEAKTNPKDKNSDVVISDTGIIDVNTANTPQAESRNSRHKSKTPVPTPKPSKHSVTSPKKSCSPSPYAFRVKSQSVPDFNMVKDEKQRDNGTVSPVKQITGLKHKPRAETNSDESSENSSSQETKSRSKSPTKSIKKAAKNKNPDKLDDLTDKAFRRKLFNHYNKSREDRNAQNAMESTLGEKKSFLRIKMADIVNTSERQHSQNRILKRLVDRCANDDTEEDTAETDAQTLPQIETKPEAPSKSHQNSQRLNLPTLRHNRPSKKTPSERKTALLPTVIKSLGPFNQNNNNHQSEIDHEANLDNWPEISSPKEADRPSPTRQTMISPDLPVITENSPDVADIIGQVLDKIRKKSMSHIENSKHKAMLMKKSCWDKKSSTEDDQPEDVSLEPVQHQIIVEEASEEEEEEKEKMVLFEGDVHDCKYLRGYDPPTSRPIEDIEDYFTNPDDGPKLKNVTFFHAGQFHGLVTDARNEGLHVK